MLLDAQNIRKVLKTIKKSAIVHIYCNRNIHSICALSIFTHILKKELLKYEIEFKDAEGQENFRIIVEDNIYILSSESQGCCSCNNNKIIGCKNIYLAAKSMDYLRMETIWPLIVAFIFYRDFLFKEYGLPDDTKENAANNTLKESLRQESTECEACKDLLNDLITQIKFLKMSSDGIFYKKECSISFLHCSTLFLALKYNLDFLLSKNFLKLKHKNSEKKIYEYLARSGISITSSNEPYSSLDSDRKSVIRNTFGEIDTFLYKSGHDLKISAIESAFLILFYLYKERELYAFLSLSKRKLMDGDKSCKFYQKIISMFKECVCGIQKLEDLLVFRIRNHSFEGIEVILEILNRLLTVYLELRCPEFSDYVICIGYETKTIIYSHGTSIVVETKNLNAELRSFRSSQRVY